QTQQQLQATQTDYAQAANVAANFPAGSDPRKQAEARMAQLEPAIRALQASLQSARAAEVQANEKALDTSAKEQKTRADQSQFEVAAAHTDPDTYAPGKIESPDPVSRVSVSVIGEAVIQLRGPINGVNLIREMVNQIDAPVGQVRVAIHTVQINGERGDRMEK